MTGTALFNFGIPHYAREMMPVAEWFAARGWRVHVVLGWNGRMLEEYRTQCLRAGMEVTELTPPFGWADNARDPQSEPAPPPRERGPLRSVLRRALVMLKVAVHILRTMRHARALLARVQPDVVFGGVFHSVGRFEDLLAECVRRRAIPQFALPNSPYIGGALVEPGRFRNLAAGMVPQSLRADYDPLNRSIAGLVPRWIRERNGLRIFMFDPVTLVPARLLRAFRHDPWLKPSPVYDVVFIESRISLRLVDEADYPHTQFVFSGKPTMDAVYRSLRDPAAGDRLRAAYALQPGEPFIICNVEPSAEHHYADWPEHWRNLGTVMDALEDVELPVLFSLHPLCDPKDYRFIEQRPRFHLVLDHRIHDLYPHCRLAVSFPCSTNLLAAEFLKPLVVYDFHRLAHADEEDWFRPERARFAHDRVELVAAIRAVLESPLPDRAHAASAKEACEIIYEEVVRRLDDQRAEASRG